MKKIGSLFLFDIVTGLEIDMARISRKAIILGQTAEMQIQTSMYNVAAYVGEFQNMHGLDICNEYGISWTTWTYKGTNQDVKDFFWFFGKPEKADCENDSYEEILRKWGDPIRTEHFAKKLAVYRQIEEYAAQ